MKTSLDCLPCLLNNALNVARFSTPDEMAQKAIMMDVMAMMSQLDMRQAPPYTAWRTNEIAWRHSGGVDAYIPQKDRSTEMAWKLLESLKESPNYQPDSFEWRVRLAVAGNIIDFSIFWDLDIRDAMKSVAEAFEKPIDSAAISRLETLMAKAKKILYLLDNAGEAVFDSMLMEPYRDKITVGVRGLPASNDMTQRELAASGLGGYPVIDNGTCLPGVIPEFVGDEMRNALDEADLVIAKGQGNFECLNETPYPLAFLFMAKCPVVVKLLQTEMRSLQVRLQGC